MKRPADRRPLLLAARYSPGPEPGWVVSFDRSGTTLIERGPHLPGILMRVAKILEDEDSAVDAYVSSHADEVEL